MRVLTRLSQSSISELATKPVAALDKRESRIMDRVLDMPEGKTDAEVIRILENSGYKMANSIRKAKLLTMSTPIPGSLSIFAYFLILLILVVAGFTYWLCYRPDYL